MIFYCSHVYHALNHRLKYDVEPTFIISSMELLVPQINYDARSSWLYIPIFGHVHTKALPF